MKKRTFKWKASAMAMAVAMATSVGSVSPMIPMVVQAEEAVSFPQYYTSDLVQPEHDSEIVNQKVEALVKAMTTEEKYTISLGLSRFITEFGTYWNQMGAASIIVTIPTLLIFMLLGKNLIEGLTAGAVKG